MFLHLAVKHNVLEGKTRWLCVGLLPWQIIPSNSEFIIHLRTYDLSLLLCQIQYSDISLTLCTCA